MYFMLSSSQPLIRTFGSFNLSHQFEKWLRFWFSLFKGESFSFVRGLWLLDLDNRKTFFMDIFASPLHLAFLDGDRKVFCFLAFGKFLWDLYFFETLSCLQESDFNLGVFAGVPQLAWLGCVLYQGVFISINAIYDFILLFFCSICSFSWRNKSNMVDVCCVGETTAQWLSWANRFT